MEAAPKLAEKPAKAPARPVPGVAAPAAGSAAAGKKGTPAGRKTAKEAAGASRQAKAGGDPASEADAHGISAKERARLAAVGARAADKKTSTTTHQTAEQATGDARAAVKEPQAQADGQALGDHAQVLQDNPPPDPLIVLKVMRIKWAIRAKRPVDEDDLGKAKPKDMAEEAGKEVSSDVQSSAKGVQTGYAAVGEKPAGTVTQAGGSMPVEGAAPATPDIHAASAVPDPIKPAEVSLDADKKGLDAKAKDAKLDREEVGLIKEGPVAEARDAQGEFGKLAIWGPDAVLKSDKELRAGASADFQKAEASALKKMHEARLHKLADAHDKKDGTKTGEEERRQKLGEKLQGIYADAEDKVKAKLEPLTTTALKMWDDGIKPLSDNFDNAIGRVDEIIKEHKSHWYNRAVDFVAGLPDWIVERYETAEKKFADGAGDLAFTISSWVNGIIRDCQKIISDARAAISREIEGLDPELKTWALEQKQVIDKQFDKLAADAEAARQNFTKELGKKLTASVREKDAKIQKLREMSKGLLQKFADFVGEFIDDPLRAIVNGLLRILGIPPEAFWAMVEKFGKVVDQIADKPRVFANNLVAAIKLGFQQFKDNIVSHLLKGLLTWLTSKLKDAGVQPPPDFSLKSVVTFILQIIGVSWPKIRGKLVKYIGEQNMKRIELAVQLLTTFINEGWDGLWKLIQDKFDPQMIVDAVLEAVKNYIVETIVKQAALRIIALFNPVGAVLQALELIYKAITWVLDNAAKIFTFIDAVVSGVANIMSGAIGGAANLIEKALGMLVPVVIDLFAKLLGLGDLPDKVKEVVGNLQAVVDKAIDKVIAWIAGKIGLKKEEDKKTEGAIGIEVPITAPDESHKLYFDKQGDKAVLMVASEPMTVSARLAAFSARVGELADTGKQEKAKVKIAEAGKLASASKETADELVRDFREAPEKTEGDEAKLEGKELQLAQLLSEIFTIFGENAGDRRLPMHASYQGNAGSGDLSFDVSPAGKNVTVLSSGSFIGKLAGEVERFAGAVKSGSKPAKDAKQAGERTRAAELLGEEALKSGPDVKAKLAAVDSKLDHAASAVSVMAAYRINDAGYILQRVEGAVRKQLEEGKLRKLEAAVKKDQGFMLAAFFEEQKRTSDTLASLKKWKSGPGRGVAKVQRTNESLVPGLGRYEKSETSKEGADIEAKLAALDEQHLVAFMRDYVRAMCGNLENIKTLEKTERAYHKLVQRLATLLDVEQERAAGAWLQIMLKVASLIDGDIAEVKGIFDAETFAHAEPGFVGEARRNGARAINQAAEKVFAKLADEQDERWTVLNDKSLLSKAEVEALVTGLTDRVLEELKKVYQWLKDE